MTRECLPESRNHSPTEAWSSIVSVVLVSLGLFSSSWYAKTYTSEGSKVLQGSGLGGSSGNHDGVLHSVVLFKGLDKLGNSGSLLADGDIDTVELLGLVVGGVPSLLVQHSIQGDGGLSGLTVTNNQLTLTTANRHHGVNGLETGLYGLVDGTTGQNAGSLELSTTLLLGVDGALAVDGVTEGIDDTAEQLRADRDIDLVVMSMVAQSLRSRLVSWHSQFHRYA